MPKAGVGNVGSQSPQPALGEMSSNPTVSVTHRGLLALENLFRPPWALHQIPATPKKSSYKKVLLDRRGSLEGGERAGLGGGDTARDNH